MYSGEGACVLVEENVSGGEKNQRTFACTANVRLHGTITLVCRAANVHSRVL